jgi:hypothetical protein
MRHCSCETVARWSIILQAPVWHTQFTAFWALRNVCLCLYAHAHAQCVLMPVCTCTCAMCAYACMHMHMTYASTHEVFLISTTPSTHWGGSALYRVSSVRPSVYIICPSNALLNSTIPCSTPPASDKFIFVVFVKMPSWGLWFKCSRSESLLSRLRANLSWLRAKLCGECSCSLNCVDREVDEKGREETRRVLQPQFSVLAYRCESVHACM